MPVEQELKPVEDSVPKVNNDVAVGSDPDFQRKWWKFETGIWSFFVVLLILDLAGLFGRGPLAKAHADAKDGSLQVDYERIERYSTPSMLTVHFGPGAIVNGKVTLWVSEDLVKYLGAQRVIPQPEVSEIGRSGITYRFSASQPPATVEFGLQPTHPGSSKLAMAVEGHDPLHLSVFVVP